MPFKALINGVDVSTHLKVVDVMPGGDGLVGQGRLYFDQQGAGMDIRPLHDVRVWKTWDDDGGIWARLFGGHINNRDTGNIGTTMLWALNCWDYNIVLDRTVRDASVAKAITLSAGHFDAQVTALLQIIQENGLGTVHTDIDPSGVADLHSSMPAVVYPGGHKLGWYIQQLCNTAHSLNSALIPHFYMGTQVGFGDSEEFGTPRLNIYNGAALPPIGISFSDTAPAGGRRPIFGTFRRVTDATTTIQRRQAFFSDDHLVVTSENAASQATYPWPYINHGGAGGTGYIMDEVIEDKDSISFAQAQQALDRRNATESTPFDSFEFETGERIQPGDIIGLGWALSGIPDDTPYRVVKVQSVIEDPDVIWSTLTVNSRRLTLFDDGSEVYAPPIEGDPIPPLPPTDFTLTSNQYDRATGDADMVFHIDPSPSPTALGNRIVGRIGHQAVDIDVFDNDDPAISVQSGLPYNLSVVAYGTRSRSAPFEPELFGYTAMPTYEETPNSDFDIFDRIDATLPKWWEREVTGTGTMLWNTASRTGAGCLKLATASLGDTAAGLGAMTVAKGSVTAEEFWGRTEGGNALVIVSYDWYSNTQSYMLTTSFGRLLGPTWSPYYGVMPRDPAAAYYRVRYKLEGPLHVVRIDTTHHTPQLPSVGIQDYALKTPKADLGLGLLENGSMEIEDENAGGNDDQRLPAGYVVESGTVEWIDIDDAGGDAGDGKRYLRLGGASGTHRWRGPLVMWPTGRTSIVKTFRYRINTLTGVSSAVVGIEVLDKNKLTLGRLPMLDSATDAAPSWSTGSWIEAVLYENRAAFDVATVYVAPYAELVTSGATPTMDIDTISMDKTGHTIYAHTVQGTNVDGSFGTLNVPDLTAPFTNMTGEISPTQHGEQPGGNLHDVAVSGVSDGFMSFTDKQNLDGLNSMAIRDVEFDAKGDILVGSADNFYNNLGVGSNGDVLTADSAQTLGVRWAAPSSGGIPATIIDAKGDLIAGTAPDTAVRLAVGGALKVLKPDTGAASGLKWEQMDFNELAGSLTDAQHGARAGGTLHPAATTSVAGFLSAADKTILDGLNTNAIPKTIVDVKGDIIAATAADTVARLAVGANSKVLKADSSQATGLIWGDVAMADVTGTISAAQHGNQTNGSLHATAVAGSSNGFMSFADKSNLDNLVSNAVQKWDFDARGDLMAATADNTPARLAVGANNKVLKADSSQATGLVWGDVAMADVTGVISDTQHGARGGGTLHPAATTSVAGFLSAVDKTTLDGLVIVGANAIPKTIVDTKGDLIVATANDTVVRLGPGGDGQSLHAKSGATEGLIWLSDGVAWLTNKSGGSVALGDVVVIDKTNDGSFTTTTTSPYADGMVGIVQETIANNASGAILLYGVASQVNCNLAITRGHYLKTHTTAKQGASGGASDAYGAFGQALSGGLGVTNPRAIIWGHPHGPVFLHASGHSLGANDPLLPNATSTQTSTFTATASFKTYLLNSASAFTANLPTAVGISGKEYTFINISTGLVTLDGSSSETIMGLATYPLPARCRITIVSDGANWQIMTQDGLFSGVDAYKSSNQSGIADSTFTKVTFDTEVYDINSEYASSTFTCKIPGYYHVIGTILTDGSVSAVVGDQYMALIYKNGANIAQGRAFCVYNGLYAMSQVIVPHLSLAVGDTVELYWWQHNFAGSTGNRTIYGSGSAETAFGISKVS